MTNKTHNAVKSVAQPTEHADHSDKNRTGVNRKNETKIKNSAGDAQENLAPFREQANHAHTH